MSIKLKPLKPNPPILSQEKDLLDFIGEANDPQKSGTASHSTQKRENFPWENPRVREDLRKTFNLRFSEKDYVKLEYLSRLKKESMHKICLDVLIPHINKMLNLD